MAGIHQESFDQTPTPPDHTPLAAVEPPTESLVPSAGNSAFAMISRISRTAGLLARSGFGRAPSLPEHRMSVRAQVQVTGGLPYTPYIRFHPRQSGAPPTTHSPVDSGEHSNDILIDPGEQSLQEDSSSIPSTNDIDASLPLCSSPLSHTHRTRFRRVGGPDRSLRHSTSTKSPSLTMQAQATSSRNLDTGNRDLAAEPGLLGSPTPRCTPSDAPGNGPDSSEHSLSSPVADSAPDQAAHVSQECCGASPVVTNPAVSHSVSSLSPADDPLVSTRNLSFYTVPSLASPNDPSASTPNSTSHTIPSFAPSSDPPASVPNLTPHIAPSLALSNYPQAIVSTDEDREFVPYSSVPRTHHRAAHFTPVIGANDITMSERAPQNSASEDVNMGAPTSPISTSDIPHPRHWTSGDVTMDAPTPHSSASGAYCTIHPSPPRPIPVPPIHTSLAHAIGKAVVEHLSSGVLEPTVQNIIDACVPRLTKILEKSRVVPPCCASGSRTTDLDDHQGIDGDDEEEEGMLPPPRRKKPGPRGKMNRLHNACRVYLRSKKILPTGPKGVLPVSAPATAVRAFNQNGESPPVMKDIALDWASNPLSASRWNHEAISVLALDFHSQLKSGAYKDVVYTEQTMNLPAIRLHCEKKLIRTHQAHRQQALIHNAPADNQQRIISLLREQEGKRLKAERKVSRRFGTLSRRKRIVSENRFRDPKTWDAIDKIVTRLGVEGMSADETDSPPAQKPKTLRHVELSWLNPSLSLLLKSVETYEPAHRIENMREHVGQSPFVRHWEPRSKETKLGPVGGLPRNWYNDDWFQGLSSGARSILIAKEEIPIPALSPWDVEQSHPPH